MAGAEAPKPRMPTKVPPGSIQRSQPKPTAASTATRGGRAAWKAFHDQFLSYGGPPIPLVRQQMMGGEAKAVF